ncbi:MAG: hypothetical protein EOO16_00145 [Chitinophagaceae bacterium]|nr:MAG: hypothetical protein EOO16_00145 [Chitinophagaceae bacterium]
MKPSLAAAPLILFSLLAAIWAGWIRAGWELPLSSAAGQHGNLMVNCFLAALIMLERAITFRQWWVRLLPLLHALALPFLLAGNPVVAHALLLAGSLGFSLLCAWLHWKHRELHYLVFVVGAACLAAGNLLLWKTGSYATAAGWWIAFLLLTIVAERLELSKFLPRTALQRRLLLLSLAGVFPGLLLAHPAGTGFLAAALAASGAWLLRYDMARKSLHAPGAHRYSARLLLAGFCWLPATSVLLLVQSRLPFGYDAVLHAFFIGFVFAMIFSHAPVILPAVLRKRLEVYHPVLYGWFVCLQASLLLRIFADVAGSGPLRRWAAIGNGVSILLFFITVAGRTAVQIRSGKA